MEKTQVKPKKGDKKEDSYKEIVTVKPSRTDKVSEVYGWPRMKDSLLNAESI